MLNIPLKVPSYFLRLLVEESATSISCLVRKRQYHGIFDGSSRDLSLLLHVNMFPNDIDGVLSYILKWLCTGICFVQPYKRTT